MLIFWAITVTLERSDVDAAKRRLIHQFIHTPVGSLEQMATLELAGHDNTPLIALA